MPRIKEVYTCYPEYEFEIICVFYDGSTVLGTEKSVIFQSVNGDKKMLSYKSTGHMADPYGKAFNDYEGKETNVNQEEFEDLLFEYNWDEYVKEDGE